jgi:hypothetical protein
MAKYRKKPVVIEAIQLLPENHEAINNMLGVNEANNITGFEWRGNMGSPDSMVLIRTLEGTMCADPKDWIIKGVKGEFYPCKPHIFERTYEGPLCDVPQQ